MLLRNIALIIGIIGSIEVYAGGQLPVGRQNQLQSTQNAQQFKNAPFFTLAVLQPATGFQSLEKFVQQEAQNIKNKGYGLMPFADWHLSVMIFAIPFPNGIVDPSYVKKASDKLVAILSHGVSQATGMNILQALTDATFEYKGLKSIGSHKFLVALFDRKPHTKAFFRVYGDIVRSFFNAYPHSWMFYGYEMVPHISVASKMRATGAASSTTIVAHPYQPIQDVKLRHRGRRYQRKLQINARWYDPATKQLVTSKSHQL